MNDSVLFCRDIVMLVYIKCWCIHVCVEGWKRNSSICYWIQKQIQLFRIHLSFC